MDQCECERAWGIVRRIYNLDLTDFVKAIGGNFLEEHERLLMIFGVLRKNYVEGFALLMPNEQKSLWRYCAHRHEAYLARRNAVEVVT